MDSRDWRQLKVLLVEDFEDTRRFMRLFLEIEGHKVVEAADGSSAIAEVAAGGCPDLVLMDLSLPGVDGLEATRRIKTEVCPEIPVVLLTAHDGKEEDAIGAGCVEVLRKPLDLDQFRETLRRYASPVAREGKV
jgi:CheY-like chemotaxis protein